MSGTGATAETGRDGTGAGPGEHGALSRGLMAQGLSKSYRGRRVVDGVSFDVRPGEVVGLLGPNGAGKTTCFYMVVGVIPVEGGRILLEGEDLTAAPMYQRARKGINYLPQEASIFRGLSVEKNLMAVAESLPLSRRERKERVEALLMELGISHLGPNQALTLSGGERRRVEIARSLVTEPKFILMDEPFAGVDPIAVAEIQRIARQLSSRGIGVLITDHNVRETLRICERATIIHEGRVIISGTPEEIVADELARRHYLGEDFELGGSGGAPRPEGTDPGPEERER